MLHQTEKKDAGESKSHDQIKASHERVSTYIRKNAIDGLWPYVPGRKPATEASAWCAIAMRNDLETAKRSLNSLLEARNTDAGWSTEPHASGRSDWTTGPALLCVRLLSESTNQTAQLQNAMQKTIDYMFDSRTEFYGSIARMLLVLSKGKSALDYARGWPWSRECFHWIEPTAYSLLALKIPSSPNNQEHQEVLQRAEQFVLDHACKVGGWNHGSSFCLGTELPPYIVTTAEALLALQEMPESKAVKSGLEFLRKTEPSQCSAMEHAWVILALSAFNSSAQNLIDSLVASQNKDGSFGVNMMVTGLCAIALETAMTSTNPLKYSGQNKRSLTKNGST